MTQTGIYNINNQVVLKRFYKKSFHELAEHLFYLSEKPSEEEIKKLKNEIFINETFLEIDAEEMEVVHQHFLDDNLKSYKAWIKNKNHLFYIFCEYKKKNFGKIVVKKASLKPKYFNELEIIDKDFIKTKNEVFYLGKKIAGADAVSFEKTINSNFYQDKNRVYSLYYNKLDILEKQQNSNYFFIPNSFLFASQEFIYLLSGWSGKIEQVSGNFVGIKSIIYKELSQIIKIIYPQKTDKECEELGKKVQDIQNYENIFQALFPNAKAKWNLNND